MSSVEARARRGRPASWMLVLGAAVPFIAVWLVLYNAMQGAIPAEARRDHERIKAALADGSFAKHLVDGEYYGHNSCGPGQYWSVRVVARGRRIERVEIDPMHRRAGAPKPPAVTALVEQVVASQRPPERDRNASGPVCGVGGAIRHALTNANYDFRESQYHPVKARPPDP